MKPILDKVPIRPTQPVTVTSSKRFSVQTNRITSREETYLRIEGAFKIKVQNRGDVDIIIFGNYRLPSYSEETFETGDTNLGFSANTAVEYTPKSAGETIDILLTNYFKTI